MLSSNQLERFIRRHGGKPAFPTTISVNELAAHYTTDHALTKLDGWETEMVFQKGDLVKLDIGVQIHGCIGDNALTVEVGNTGRHTEQIRAQGIKGRAHRDHASRHPMAHKVGPRRRNRSSMLDSSRLQPLRAPTRALGAPCWGQRSCVRLREGPPGVPRHRPGGFRLRRGTVQHDRNTRAHRERRTEQLLQHLQSDRTDLVEEGPPKEAIEAAWRSTCKEPGGAIQHAPIRRAVGVPDVGEALPRGG